MSARRAERKASPLSELARVLVHFDHIARCIVNANHCIMQSALGGAKGEKDCVDGLFRGLANA